jgi:predicted nucleotidyltransferase
MKLPIIKDRIKGYFEKIGNIDFALIFGSYAMEKNHNKSDIDIAIHLNRELTLLEIGTIVSELEEVLHVETDIIILNNLYKNRPEFAYNIIRDSVPILVNSNELFIEFKKNSYLFYMDTEYLRKIVYEGLNKRIATRRFGESNYAG